MANPATAVLDGLPEAWDVGETYTLTIRVEGGPEALPDPAPKGGFELEVDAGELHVPAGSEDLLRRPYPTLMTYEPAGTMMRTWTVEWQAPSLDQRPAEVGFWLAVLSANGNHVVATNVSDGGEHGDVADALAVRVAPSMAAQDAWAALPLGAPTVTEGGPFDDEMAVLLKGRHTDANATAIAWSLNGGPWSQNEAPGTWWIQIPHLSAGNHTVAMKSVGAGRESPVITHSFEVEGGFLPTQESPAWPVIFPLLVIFWRRP